MEGETSGDYQKTLLKLIDKVGEIEDTSEKEEEEDAKKLYKAMHRVGTDEDTVIEVVTRNSNSNRQKLKSRYEELYKQVSGWAIMSMLNRLKTWTNVSCI